MELNVFKSLSTNIDSMVNITDFQGFFRGFLPSSLFFASGTTTGELPRVANRLRNRSNFGKPLNPCP